MTTTVPPSPAATAPAAPASTPGAPTSDTRERLVLAAMNLFWEKGYAATGLSEILEESGTRAGSLYHFFPTKEKLLLAVLDQHRVILDTVILRPLRTGSDPAQRVLGLIEFYRAFMLRTECALGCPMLNLAAEISDTFPAAREKLAVLFAVLRVEVRKALGDRKDAEAAATLIVCALQGAILQSRAARSVLPLEACAQQLGGVLGEGRRVRDTSITGVYESPDGLSATT